MVMNGHKKSLMKRINEEKLLNDMFVVLEYSDNFKQFIENIPEDARLELFSEIKRYYGD
jgi:hypothetical protein